MEVKKGNTFAERCPCVLQATCDPVTLDLRFAVRKAGGDIGGRILSGVCNLESGRFERRAQDCFCCRRVSTIAKTTRQSTAESPGKRAPAKLAEFRCKKRKRRVISVGRFNRESASAKQLLRRAPTRQAVRGDEPVTLCDRRPPRPTLIAEFLLRPCRSR